MYRIVRACLVAAIVSCSTGAVASPTAAPEAAGIGSVHMPISCGPRANATFDRGLALLHSFWYDHARAEFDRMIASDPTCAMGYWGAAMTFNHPLWSDPPDTDVRAALGYLRRAHGATQANDREQRFVRAVEALYGDGQQATKNQRDVAYRDAMLATYGVYHDDETALFTALAILGVQVGGVRGRDPATSERAAAILEPLHARQPNHPGVLHYLIHAYDTDNFATRGLPAARAYAATAPAVPHALHMPSHITLRLGLWKEARDSNLAAWNADLADIERSHQPPSARDFHNLMFGQYASMQLGRYAEAKHEAEIALDQYDENLREIARRGLTGDEADALRGLEINAVPIAMHYVLDSGDYSLADRLAKPFASPYAQALADNVRATAAAARHDAAGMAAGEAAARKTIAEFKGPPNGALVGAHEALALIAHARGDEAGARAAVLAAVAADDASGRHPQPTNPGIPARELYARLLWEQGDAAGALAQYRIALGQFPNRAMSIIGAARSAARAGDGAAARAYAAQFLAQWSDADAGLPAVAEAKALLRSAP